VKPERRIRKRLTAVHEVVEEERRKIKEWDEKDKMGQLGDASIKL